MSLPSIFDQCKPRSEVLAGQLPDSIFAADLWEVVLKKPETHPDYLDPPRFFAGTHPTENLKLLVKEIAERLAGVPGGTPVFRLETGFGGGKTHALIASVHAAREGDNLAKQLSDYNIAALPKPGTVKVAAFVGEESDPLQGVEISVGGTKCRTYTPWGQLALMAGGQAGYELVRQNDEQGGAPARSALAESLGKGPVLIVIDELVLYMARAFALQQDHARSKVNSQWATFLQTLFSVAASRPQTAVILTLPSEQDANRKLTGELKQFIPTVLDTVHETVDELEQTAARQVRNLTPTQSHERAAVLVRRLFDSVNAAKAKEIAQAFAAYYEEQRSAGVQIDSRAYDPSFIEQIRVGYPFHPELIRLFAERLADIPEFQATRGALRLVARTIRGVWARKAKLKGTLLLQPQHVDLTRSEIRDEILARLGRTAFERGLEEDVVRPEAGTHANQVEVGWPWPAATESALTVFLHSLPDASKGVTPAEVALAVGRPGRDLAYVQRGLEETERRAWYMRREGDHFFFRTRAGINKRFLERFGEVQPGEIREELDKWALQVYSGFGSFQIIPFPADHTAIPDSSDRVRLVIVHYDKECGAIGGGERLNFTKALFTKTGVNAGPRRYRNNVVFLLADSVRLSGLKDAVRSLMAWERVRKDIETEQANLAQGSGMDYRSLKDLAKKGASGVPVEFVALENDLLEVQEKLGQQEVNVRTKLLDAYRVLGFPKSAAAEEHNLFLAGQQGPLLECYRVDFGDVVEPAAAGRGRRNVRQAVAEGPILQCLRHNSKLVPEATPAQPLVLAPALLKRPPLWQPGERRLATEEIWDRLRREPDLPMLLKPTDLFPSFRGGVAADESLWIYYNQPEKKVFTKETVDSLAPVLAANHFLYDPAAAVADRIMPVGSISPQEIWDHLWQRQGAEYVGSVATIKLLEAAKQSAHFPVLPERGVLWQALQEGARENRWVLYLRGPNLAIGAQEMNEWPGTPRLDETTEVWVYQAALDQGIYPRKTGGAGKADMPLTPANLRSRCWPGSAPELTTEDMERFARGIWRDLNRPRLENVLREGVKDGAWAAWRKTADEVFYIKDDAPSPSIQVGPAWSLVDPAAPLAQELDQLRPGRGPQPVARAGTPRQVLTEIWDDLGNFNLVQLSEMTLTVNDRDSLDNSLFATWADRPKAGQIHASVTANGQREVGGKQETVSLAFEGRFEEVRSMLSPVWPFEKQGDLDVGISVRLLFNPPLALTNDELTTYRTALMNCNQGNIEMRVVPVRARRQGGG